MIISKTPFRIPFAGGLTDLPRFAHAHGGVTVSSTIDKHVYVGVKRNVDGYFNLKYMDVHEKVSSIADVKHDLIREALRVTGLEAEALDIYIMVDLNSESGLGSSGAVTVGLLHALHAHKSEVVTPQVLVDEAARIEVEILDGASGYHDPAICAIGSLQQIDYDRAGIHPRPVSASDGFLKEFQKSLVFFYSGRHHKSKPSLDLLNANMEAATPVLKDMKGVALGLVSAFGTGDLREVATHIQNQQDLKQRLPGMFEDDYVRDVVRRARDHGAACQLPGGKVGAFLMVCCPDGQQKAIRKEFSDFREVEFHLSQEGSTAHEL
jgi:D-glycero-alpha-D-manno-heptose-7-phosphate kinase